MYAIANEYIKLIRELSPSCNLFFFFFNKNFIQTDYIATKNYKTSNHLIIYLNIVSIIRQFKILF